MTREQDPALDAELRGVTFTQEQVEYLSHHLANGLTMLTGARDVGKMDEQTRKWIQASTLRLKTLLLTIRKSAVGNPRRERK